MQAPETDDAPAAPAGKADVPTTTETTTKLANGVAMPRLALGTSPLVIEGEGGVRGHNERYAGFLPEQVYRSVELSLRAGIRHIDTALVYRSHKPISHVLGNWFASGRLKREDVFLTTKINVGRTQLATDGTTIDLDGGSPEDVELAVRRDFDRCLEELGVGYVDLMLLHWPAGFGSVSSSSSSKEVKSDDDEEDRTRLSRQRSRAWGVLEEYYRKGWARAIGVCNYSEVHLDKLMEDGATIRPMVNQIEASVYCWHEGIVEYCRNNGIAIQAWSPLGRGVMSIHDDPVVGSIAKERDKNAGQIALRYLIQKGLSLAVWSTSEERINSNPDIFRFELNAGDMDRLDSLCRSNEGSWGLPSPYDMP